MAAVGAEVTGSWFLPSGVVSFFILLLLLSIFLAALCSDCRRHSFDLRDSEVDKNPSSLIRVVSLEEAVGPRENPTINEIQNDEKVSITPWRSHLGAPQTHQDVRTSDSAAVMMTSESESDREENSVQFTPWRSHLVAPQSPDVSGSTPSDSDHIYHVIGGGRGSGGGDADVSSPPTNQEPEEERSVDVSDFDGNLLYAQVSKKVRQAPPPAYTPEEAVQEEEEEEFSPPLPDRETQLEG